MAETYHEENSIPIKADYDVIVVGGGVAGVSAALAARRQGCEVLLLEKSVMLGGLATLGMIIYYLPLCDGMGNKIVGGIAEELLYASIKYGFHNLPEYWRKGGPIPEKSQRYRTVFSASAFTIALDELIEQAGVHLLFDTVFSMPIMEGRRCTGVTVDNKSGRSVYRAKVIVDTTGDADVMERCGASCVEDQNWLTCWTYYTDLKQMRAAAESGNFQDGIRMKTLGRNMNASKEDPEKTGFFRGVSAEDVTKFVIEGRKLVKQHILNSESKDTCFFALPGMAQFRTTRRITGFYELTIDDKFKHFDDSIGCVTDWRKSGPVYEIPYRCLISKELDNVITAGRTIASKGGAWEVTRVIPPAALTGEAAGVASALVSETSCAFADVPLQELQDRLAKGGVMIHQ